MKLLLLLALLTSCASYRPAPIDNEDDSQRIIRRESYPNH
jgi:hypothetical protein